MFVDFQFAQEKFGGLDILVLNHIAVSPMAEWTGTEENFKYLHLIHDVNYKAYVHLATYAMPLLEESHGSLVVVSSIVGVYKGCVRKREKNLKGVCLGLGEGEM